MKIRFAIPSDAPLLLDIYAQYIDTPITFECKLPAVEEFSLRINDIVPNYPYLVCEEDGKIVGYAYAHRHKDREAYQWNAELSVYIDKNYTSKGLGKKFYSLLIEILLLQGINTVYGGVTGHNLKSERLHVSLGFSKLGTYHKTGFKCGSWHDVSWYEKQIAPYVDNPDPFVPIKDINSTALNNIINRYNAS